MNETGLVRIDAGNSAYFVLTKAGAAINSLATPDMTVTVSKDGSNFAAAAGTLVHNGYVHEYILDVSEISDHGHHILRIVPTGSAFEEKLVHMDRSFVSGTLTNGLLGVFPNPINGTSATSFADAFAILYLLLTGTSTSAVHPAAVASDTITFTSEVDGRTLTAVVDASRNRLSVATDLG